MDYKSEQIELATKGIFYPENSPLSKGYVEVKYPTMVEESILLSTNSFNKSTALNEFIESLFINEFSSVKLEDFYLVDLNSLILDIRILTYGPEHVIELGGKTLISDLSVLEFNKEVQSSLSNKENRTLTLHSGHKVTLKLQTVRESNDNKQLIKKLNVPNMLFFYDTISSIEDIDGDNNKLNIEKTLRDRSKVTPLDGTKIRKKIKEMNPGYDIENIKYYSPDSKETEEGVTLPLQIGSNFFWFNT